MDTTAAPELETSTPQRFSELAHVHEHTVTALERAGLTTAFPVQSAVVPVASTGRDVLVKSPTGSGKTLAFGLPIIAQVERGDRTPRAIILVPGRELAIQVRDELVPIAWSLQQRVVAVFGGGIGQKHGKLAASAPIIVATPGRLVDLIRTRVVNVSQAPILVLDEADRMLDMGFTPQVEEIAKAMTLRTQTMLFSATLEGRVSAVAERLTSDPLRIERDEVPGDGGEIEHRFVATSAAQKADAVVEQLDTKDRDLAVVFVRTQKGADNLRDMLAEAGLSVTTIHGGMMQQERLAEYGVFQRGEKDVLVATDVFARGMDLDRITHVINYELPEDADMYRHRIGRTGRAGRSGVAITLVTPQTRRIVEGLLLDLGLPTTLLGGMPTGGAIQKKAKPGKRARDARALREAQAAEAKPAVRQNDPTFAKSGNGRGKRLTSTAPVRGAAPGSAGRGTISAYDPRKGFGFIKQQAGGKDVFFHRRAVGKDVEDHKLRPGVPVTFGLERGDGTKLRAERVLITSGGSGQGGTPKSRGGAPYQSRGGSKPQPRGGRPPQR